MSRTGYKTDMRVYDALLRLARRGACPLERIGAEARVSRETVQASIKRLAGRGMVETVPVRAGSEPWSVDLAESGRPRVHEPTRRDAAEIEGVDAAMLKALAERPEGDFRANASALARSAGINRHAAAHALKRLEKARKIRVWREGAGSDFSKKICAEVIST